MKRTLVLVALCVVVTTGAVAQQRPGDSSGAPSSSSQPPPLLPQKPSRIRVSGKVAATKITRLVQPVYPEVAKLAKVEGTIVLHCIIGTDGKVKEVQYVSGPPLLIKTAMDAVRQWTYQPTLLNGEPVEVDTAVSVVFTLGGKAPGDEAPQESSPPKPANGGAVAIVAPTAPIDPQFKADILRLMDLTHYKANQEAAIRKIFEPLRPAMLANTPATPNREKILSEYIDRLIGLLQTEDFTNRLEALYAQYLTDGDVKAAIAFYETPAGQRYLENSTKMAPELVALGQRVAIENIPSILKNLCQDYPELQGEAKFCGSPDPNRKSLLLNPAPMALGN
ncbi:MAG: TonB family protein [Candidatus Acidiferrales bacterium]